MAHRPFVIGLTGNIATGKSTVAQMLARLGAQVIDADEVAHEVMRPEGPAYRAVIETFGPEILTEEGTIDRARLGSIVFRNPAALQRLEAAVHPATLAEVERRIAQATQPVVVVEAIKLIESGMHLRCDTLWVVSAPRALQIARLMSSRGLSEEEATVRIDAQPPQEEKAALADRVFINDGDLDHLRRQVEAAWSQIQQELGSALLCEGVLMPGGAPRGMKTSKGWRPGIPPRGDAPSAQADGQPKALQGRFQSPSDFEEKAGASPNQSRRQVEHRSQAGSEPTAPAQGDVEVRRARRGDVPAICALFRKRRRTAQVDEAEALEWLFSKGLLVAIHDDTVVGVAAWQIENLISVTDVIMVSPARLWAKVGSRLLAAIEAEAQSLMCEANIVLLPAGTARTVRAVIQRLGYQSHRLDALHPIWQGVLIPFLTTEPELMVKRLRERMIMIPI